MNFKSDIGKLHSDFIMGEIGEKELREKLDEIGVKKDKADILIDRWNKNLVKSSVDKALDELEEYFGTERSGDTVTCQDIITPSDEFEVEMIEDNNDVRCQIGRYSVRVIGENE